MNDRTRHSDPSDSKIDILLTSYLDGELDTSEAQDVEQRLSQDGHFLRRMQELQKTWDAIDVIPRADATSSFTKSTLELVIDRAELENYRSKRRLYTWPLRIVALTALPLLVLAGSYYMAKQSQQKPVDQLVMDLPIIENLDLYEVIDSVEFLSMLEENGVFQNDDVYFDGVAE